MERKNKQALYDEILVFKQNSPLTKVKFIFIGLFIVSLLVLGIFLCLISYADNVSNNIYEIVNKIQEDYIVIPWISPLIMLVSLIIIENKINGIINTKVAKYLGKDMETNSTLVPINFELLPNKIKRNHIKKSIKTTNMITWKYQLYNFLFNIYTNINLNGVLNCLYRGIDYEITILNTYWERRKRFGRITYIEDFGMDYFGNISFDNKNFNIDAAELLNKIQIDYKGHEISSDNKINLLIVKKHKLKLKGSLEEKVEMDINFAEEIIKKATILAEHIIDKEENPKYYVLEKIGYSNET